MTLAWTMMLMVAGRGTSGRTMTRTHLTAMWTPPARGGQRWPQLVLPGSPPPTVHSRNSLGTAGPQGPTWLFRRITLLVWTLWSLGLPPFLLMGVPVVQVLNFPPSPCILERGDPLALHVFPLRRWGMLSLTTLAPVRADLLPSPQAMVCGDKGRLRPLGMLQLRPACFALALGC